MQHARAGSPGRHPDRHNQKNACLNAPAVRMGALAGFGLMLGEIARTTRRGRCCRHPSAGSRRAGGDDDPQPAEGRWLTRAAILRWSDAEQDGAVFDVEGIWVQRCQWRLMNHNARAHKDEADIEVHEALRGGGAAGRSRPSAFWADRGRSQRTWLS